MPLPLLRQIATVHSDYHDKFGIPRQSGIVPSEAMIVFEPDYRCDEAIRGITDYSHLWLIWLFSQAIREKKWSPTVRPPRLGGNRRMGVFATRSPYRPNPIALSSVRLLGIEKSAAWGSCLIVGDCDILDGTPVLDIKPYLAYTDAHPDAKGGFADAVRGDDLTVADPTHALDALDGDRRATLEAMLAHDPRPHYIDDPSRVYGMTYADMEVRFTVERRVLTVRELLPAAHNS